MHEELQRPRPSLRITLERPALTIPPALPPDTCRIPPILDAALEKKSGLDYPQPPRPTPQGCISFHFREGAAVLTRFRLPQSSAIVIVSLTLPPQPLPRKESPVPLFPVFVAAPALREPFNIAPNVG